MLPKNDYMSISWVIGDKEFSKHIQTKDYPYGLKKLRFYFYQGDGTMCFPVEKTKHFLSIFVKDPTDRSKIATRASQIPPVLKDYKDGVYVIDFNTMKVVYDCEKNTDVIPFWIIFINNEKTKIPPYVLAASIDEDGKKELCLIKGNLVQFAEFLTGGSFMLEGGSAPDEFATNVYLRIMQNHGIMGELDSQVYALETFLIPKGKSTSSSDLLDELTKSIEKIYGDKKKSDEKSNEKSLLLSKILEQGVLPTNHIGAERYITVEVDVKPEDVKIIASYVRGDRLFIVVENDLEKMADKIIGITDLDFVVWLSMKKEEEKEEEESNENLDDENVDYENFRHGME